MTAKVAICTPCQDTVHAGFAYDLARLVGVCATDPSLTLSIHQVKGTYIPQQRETLVQNALAAEATHVLFVDADMRFPKDALHRLLAHHRPIVAANYSTRRPPILPTAQHKSMGYAFTQDSSSGLLDVTHAGTGLMLIKTDVFRELAEPWFVLAYDKKRGAYVSEDYFFCQQAGNAGIPITIDQDLSKEVRHCGEIEWSYEHALQTLDAHKDQLLTPADERKLELVPR